MSSLPPIETRVKANSIRMPAMLLASLLLGGCSVLDQISLGSGAPVLDPSKIYLQGREQVLTHRGEVDTYQCLVGPLMCRSFGVRLECGCRSIGR